MDLTFGERVADDERIDDLAPDELEWLESSLQYARELTQQFEPNPRSSPQEIASLAALDLCWNNWLSSWEAAPRELREDPNPHINAFGITLGQHLVNRYRLRWIKLTDKLGTDVAVYADSGAGRVFPTNFVSKRFTRREKNFFALIFPVLGAEIEKNRRANMPDLASDPIQN